jgi:hypothetical protein
LSAYIVVVVDIGFVIPDASRRTPEALQEFVASEVPRWGRVATSLADGPVVQRLVQGSIALGETARWEVRSCSG